MVMYMDIAAFAKTNTDVWDRYNSSLLIEVTRPSGVFTCTGVAVSKTIILTAAHCLEGKVSNVRIFTNSFYDPKESSLEIQEFKLHPTYDPKKSRSHSDIAKITLKKSLPDFVKVQTIYEGRKFSGSFMRLGFGERDHKNVRTLTNPTLRKIDIKEEILEMNDEYSRSGDSGGPIFMENSDGTFLLALHSTFSYGPEGNFSLNPLLAAYVPWIFNQ